MKHKFEDEYKKLVVPYAPDTDSSRRIIVSDAKIKKVRALARKIALAKSCEEHHKIDGENEFKRQFTGLLGEAALEEYFGIDIIDYSVGDSKEYNVADLKKLVLILE